MRKYKAFFPSLLLCVLCSLFISTTAYSSSIKERMVERLPAINSLKDQGAVGENNKGFLEYRSAAKPEVAIVSAENTDRGAVYAAIGKKQNVSAALVGQRRANMIAQNGKSGHWFQKADGSWYKK